MRRIAAFLSLLALVSTACARGGSAPRAAPASHAEGELDLVAWPGLVEDGSNDPSIDWVHPFERATGCQVTVKYATSAEEMVGLLRQRGSFDGGSVSSDVGLRLVDHGDVVPLDATARRLRNVVAPVRGFIGFSRGGVRYGAPFVYGPNALLFDAAVVRPSPRSWAPVWSARSRFAGRVTTYDVPVALAEAALYLRAHEPSLKITDPYELTRTQFDAVVRLARTQASLVGRYWGEFTDELDAFAGGETLIGVGRPIVLDLVRSVPVRAVLPSEGATGWVDAWMASSRATHPVCMRAWIAWTATPGVQAMAARWYGAAPANALACDALRRAVGAVASTIRYGRCGDAAFASRLAFWRTPERDCGGGRVDCVDWRDWASAWSDVVHG